MAVGYLNERTQKMIDLILKQSGTLGMKELAAELSVSVRTVYNELDKANEWLDMKKLPLVRTVRGRVQPFAEKEKAELYAGMQVEQPDESYIFTPSERIRMIVCQMIVSREPVYAEDLMRTCLVSRNTIFTDLQAAVSQLKAYQLGIGYQKKTGYWIDGDPVRRRAIFFLYFSMLEPLLSSRKLDFLDMEGAACYLERIQKIEKELRVSYVRNDMLALAVMIPVMEAGEDRLYFSDVSTKKVRDSREYRLVQKYFKELPDIEKIYLALHFLGGRLAAYTKDEAGTAGDETVLEIARNLAVEFERRACVTFRQKKELVMELSRHIAASIYRYRFGIQIGSPVADDIKREYPYVFDIMRAAVQYLEQQVGVQISDSEVAYLALHFGSHLEYAQQDEKKLRILVVCMNGVATGNMISHELARILPQAEISGVMAVSKIVNPQKICDIIVSSVKMKAVVPVIVVNPILNDFDRRNIMNHPMIRSRFGFVDTDALFRLVKKYVPAKCHADLKNDLEKFIASGQEEMRPVLNPGIWRLADFLTEDRIVFLDGDGRKQGERQSVTGCGDSLAGWERALYHTACPLLARGSISREYVQCIIERLAEAGPYMFVTKDLILAHARPENGVKHLDFSIGIAPDGIAFECGKRARVVFCLAVEDQQKHMGILRDIRKTLAKPQQIDELMKAEDAGSVCGLLRLRLLDV